MKRLMRNVRAVLAGRRGETLVESIVSILVFSILMTGVAVMMSASLRITSVSVKDAASRQKTANDAILELFLDGTGTETELVLTSADGINVTIAVVLPSGGDFVAFAPEVS